MKVHVNLDRGANDSLDAVFIGRVLDAAVPLFSSCLEDRGGFVDPMPEVEISVSLLTPEEMAQENHTHRGIPSPTDVLSFPLWEEDGEFRPGRHLPVLPLGDILLCPEYIRENAPVRSDEGIRQEMALMVVHGFLHLLAWDHCTEELARSMESRQKQILTALMEKLPRHDTKDHLS